MRKPPSPAALPLPRQQGAGGELPDFTEGSGNPSAPPHPGEAPLT